MWPSQLVEDQHLILYNLWEKNQVFEALKLLENVLDPVKEQNIMILTKKYDTVIDGNVLIMSL